MAEVDIAPRFGAELKDGFKPVNTWVSNSIAWLDDVQQFYRDRSAIEKEYSTKLSALAKKYFEKKVRKASSLSVGDTPTATPGSLESASMTTWAAQLTTLESRAAEHERFSTELIASIAEPVKHLASRCEDIRKQHVDYASKIEKERDGAYADLKKTKGKYDTACQDLESRRKKADSSYDFSRQKAQVAYQQQQIEAANAKNTYLVDINITNKQKEKYYHEYVPDLLDSMQDLTESRVAKLNSIWFQAAQLETNTLSRSTELVKHLSSEILRNKPILDSMMFVRHNTPHWQEPQNFVFEPSPVWLEDDKMVTTDSAKTFLRHRLGRGKAQLSELKSEADTKRREWESMKRAKQNVRDGKDKRDEVEVARGVFVLMGEVHEIDRRKFTAETEVLTIVAAVGDVTRGGRNHDFKAQTFKIPTNCDLCGERIWGLSAKGFDCRECGFTCHSKCEMKVPAECPGEQDKDQRRRLKVERQEAAKGTELTEADVVPERQSSGPSLSRSDTVNSMNTLSSGYAASANRSISDIPATAEPTSESNKPAPKKPSITSRPRVLAPPPAQYVSGGSNGDPSQPNERRAKMLYPYQENAAGEITVQAGKEVVVVEPDDGSGWIKVRQGTSEGLVPAAYTEMLPARRIQSSELERPDSTYSAASSASLAGSTAGSDGRGPKKKGPAVAPKRGAKKLQFVEALYEYTARSDAEHSMVEGERFVLVNKDAGEGWSDVEKSGVVKCVPANYIQEV